tara:strand:- start:118 stop:4122 length:4005 start_codon:yes stop_codon:yes gene_type:complete
MYTKFISKPIQEKLKAKERALARLGNQPQEQQNNDSLELKDLASRTVFVRMCSNKSKVPNILISGGEHNDRGIPLGFGDSYKDRRGNTDEEGNPVDNSGIRAVPGIKDITVEYKGGFKAIRECTINWSVPAIEDLDRLTPYFLTVGKTVVVDWGWVNANKKSLRQQIGVTPFIERNIDTTNNTVSYSVDQEIFTNPQQRVIDAGGDYDAIGGRIKNFNYTLREDGGFDCITTITALGAALFHKPVDVSGDKQGTRKSKKDSSPVFTPPDTLINFLLNLKNVLKYNVLGIEKDREFESLYKLSKGERGLYSNAIYKIIPFSGRKTKAISEKFSCIVTNDSQNPDVILTLHPEGKENIFVTWGYFEDQILNRYLSYNGGSEDGSGIKMTMRSIDTILDAEGKAISTKELQFGELDFEEEDELQTKYNVNLDVEEYNSTLKQPTLIRYPSLLYPIDPMKFFILETNSLIVATDKKTGAISEEGLQTSFFKEKLKIGGDVKKRIKEFLHAFLDMGFQNKADFSSKSFNAQNIGTREKGKLRNIYINIKEIQKAFGITNADSNDTTKNNVSPPGTIGAAVTNLLNELNGNFHNCWDFDLAVDQYDSTNIKVVDKSDTNNDNPKYTTYEGGTDDKEGRNSHKVQDLGLFKFPSFKIGSIVKTQNLEFKIPDAQAVTILYGANKEKGQSDSSAKSRLDKLFRLDKVDSDKDPYADKFLESLETSNFKVKDEVIGEATQSIVVSRQVGSYQSDENSKIVEGEGISLNIKESSYEWKRYLPDVEKTEKPDSNPKTTTNYEVDNFGNLKYVTRKITKDGKNPISETVNKTFYSYDSTNKTLILESNAQGALNSYINASSPTAEYDVNSLIPADLTLEIDGTGGIIPGDIIQTDYIQNKYKAPISFTDSGGNRTDAGPLTYFQLFGVTQKIDPSGWKTELTSKMRINYINDGIDLEYKVPVDNPVEVKTSTIQNYDEPERPFIPVPIEEEDIVGDQALDDLDFEDVPEFQQIPAPVNRPNIPVSMEDEDIEGDQELEDLDFDEIPPWIPPPYPSTLALRRAKIEIENQPERVPDESPPDVPLIPVGDVLSPEDINALIEQGLESSNISGNSTDLVEYPPEPDPRAEPALPSQPIRRGGDYGNLNPLSLLDQIKSQKIIYVQPSFEVEKETGEIQKPQRFETPQVQEVDYVSSPVEVAMAVNENIKKELPEVIEVETPQELNFIEPISTYKFQYEQNEILYALREDWRPLYQEADGSLTGARYKGKGQNRVENRLVRSGQSKAVRQAYWDNYIEGKNETGISQTKFVDKDNFQIFPPVQPTGDLLRRERDTYWYGEFNPKYPLPPL